MKEKIYHPEKYDKTIREAQRRKQVNTSQLSAEDAHIVLTVDVLDAINLYLIPFKKDGKIGFIDKDGALVIEPIYDEHKGEFFREDNIVGVRKGKYWSAIDSKGKELFPFEYSHIAPSCDSRLLVLETWDGYEVQDLSFEPYKVILKNEYKPIFPFRYGFAKAKKDGKWGIIDSSGKLVLDNKYCDLYSFHDYPMPTTRVRETEDSELQDINLYDLK